VFGACESGGRSTDCGTDDADVKATCEDINIKHSMFQGRPVAIGELAISEAEFQIGRVVWINWYILCQTLIIR